MTDLADAPNLADMVRAQGTARGYSTAFEFEGRRTSFAGLDIHTNRVAHGLAALAVKPHERVAYLGKNSDIYFELLLGAIKAQNEKDRAARG
ncbi:MAG TPA: AMP-binding protein [Burkholderiales bacterium]|nr:AMP-binding protein [Burkholderiales bacterium]